MKTKFKHIWLFILFLTLGSSIAEETKKNIYVIPIQDTIDLGIVDDISVTIPRGQRKNLKAHFTLDKKLQAPIVKGENVGTVYVQLEGENIAEYPLVSMQTINEGGFFRRMTDSVKLMFAEDN